MCWRKRCASGARAARKTNQRGLAHWWKQIDEWQA
jgi:hypothetical protein